MIVPDRRDARGIGIAFLGEHPVGPGRALVDREARRAIAADPLARGLFDLAAGAREILAELRLAQGEDALMVPAVAGDLVTGLGDAADQSGMARGDPAEDEEARLHPGLVEQPEHRVGVALDPALARLPRIA